MKKTTALLCLLLAACDGNSASTSPRTLNDPSLSEDAQNSLETANYNAMRGSANAHFYLGMTYCGQLCLTPPASATAAQKEAMEDRLNDTKKLGIKPDYVRSYAHFLLADDAKSSEEGYRKLLETKMSSSELQAARATAAEWKAAEIKEKTAPLPPATVSEKTKTKVKAKVKKQNN